MGEIVLRTVHRFVGQRSKSLDMISHPDHWTFTGVIVDSSGSHFNCVGGRSITVGDVVEPE